MVIFNYFQVGLLPCLCTYSTQGIHTSEAASTYCMAFIIYFRFWQKPRFSISTLFRSFWIALAFCKVSHYSIRTRQLIFLSSWYVFKEQICTSLFWHWFTKPIKFLDWENCEKARTLDSLISYWEPAFLEEQSFFFFNMPGHIIFKKVKPSNSKLNNGERINRASDALLRCTKRLPENSRKQFSSTADLPLT